MTFWYDLKIRNKVLLVLIPSVLVTICAIAYLSVQASQEALKTAAFNQLVAVRELKASQIEEYFKKIRNQVETFSENKMIVDAMEDFSASFDTMPFDIRPSQGDLSAAKQRLSTYYATQFLPKLSQNTGE